MPARHIQDQPAELHHTIGHTDEQKIRPDHGDGVGKPRHVGIVERSDVTKGDANHEQGMIPHPTQGIDEDGALRMKPEMDPHRGRKSRQPDEGAHMIVG